MTRTRLALALPALALLAAIAAPARAQTIDQSQPNVGSRYAGWQFSSIWQGQTFTPTANTVAGAGFFLRGWGDNVSTTGNLTVQLWSARPDLGGTFLSGGTSPFTVSGSYAGGGWFDVFWAPVSVTPNSSYALVLQTSNADYNVITGYDNGNYNSYTGGDTFYQMEFAAVTDPYSSNAADLAFREYSVGTSTVPEPASVALVAAGLIAMGGVARRKRMALNTV